MATEKEPSSRPRRFLSLGTLPYVLALASGFLSWVWSKLRTPFKQSVDAVHPQDSTNKAGDGSRIEPPAGAPVIPGPSEEDDSCKRRQENRDRLRLGTEIATLIAVLAYAFVAYHQLQEMRKATEAARDSADAAKEASDATRKQAETSAKQLELSERPWVEASILRNGPLTFNVNGANIPLKFILRNTGQSPAVNVWIHTQGLILNAVPTVDPEMLRRKLCTEGRNRKDTLTTLFPGAVFPQEIEVGIPNEMLRSMKDVGKMTGNMIDPTVAVCIIYRPTFSDVVYETSYIISVLRVDKHNRPYINFKVGETVEADKLRLRLYPFSPGQAK